jgi:Zn-dependent M16 (insulinase) family peptidase
MRLFRHNETGLQVMLTSAPGPQIDLGIVLATPAHDNAGVPHTLEHLVFLGCKTYPYRGVLDLVANRVLADGTNAFTAQCQTVYTASSQSRTGFAELLPIYMDHLVRPLLSDDAFYSEVHHVNKEGEDTGVVYAEMAARQDKDWSRMWRAGLRSMYGDTVFSNESGGLLEDLRSLTNEKIREFHERYYRLDNMMVCITGSIQPTEIFDALDPWMDEWAPSSPMPERPFAQAMAELKPVTSTSTVEILFPDGDDESPGSIAWVTRSGRYGEFLEVLALNALLELVCDTAVAPLRRALVDSENALCADIAWYVSNDVDALMEIMLVAVDPENLVDAAEAIRVELLAASKDASLFDMASPTSRLRKIVENNRWAWLAKLEDSQRLHSEVVDIAQRFMSFGDMEDVMTLERACRQSEDFLALLAKPSEWWQQLFVERFLDVGSVVVMGRPSAELAAEMVEQEAERVRARRAEIGEEEIVRQGKAAEEAAERSNTLPPRDVLTSIPTPDLVASLFDVIYLEDGLVVENPEDFVPEGDDEDDGAASALAGDPVALRSATLQSMVSAEIARGHVPRYPTMLADVGASAFARAMVIVDTNDLPDHLRPLLSVILSVLFELPIGEKMSSDEATEHVEQVALHYWVRTGVATGPRSSAIGQALVLNVATDHARFPDAVSHLAAVFHQANVRGEGGPNAVRAAAARVLQQASTAVRDGANAVALALSDKLYNGRRLNSSAMSSLHAARALEPLVDALSDTGSERADRALDTIAGLLTRLRQLPVRLAVVGDLVAGAGTYATLASAFGRAPAGVVPRIADLPRIRSSTDFKLSPQPQQGTTVALTSQSEVSGYFLGARLGLPPALLGTPASAAVQVVSRAATATEGPLYSRIRGCGAAYGCFLTSDSRTTKATSYKTANMERAVSEFIGLTQDVTTWLPDYLVDGQSIATALLIGDVASRASAGVDVIARRLGERGASVRGDVMRLQAVTLSDAHQAFEEVFAPTIVSPTVIAYVTGTSEKDVAGGTRAARLVGGGGVEAVSVEEYFGGDSATYFSLPWALAALALVTALGGGGRP